jgi:hypothetical protein
MDRELRGDEGEEGQNGTTGFHFRKALKKGVIPVEKRKG